MPTMDYRPTPTHRRKLTRRKIMLIGIVLGLIAAASVFVVLVELSVLD